jgi:hypothetical protein
LPQKSISVVRVSLLVRVASWIVPLVQRNKDDPRSHANEHETKIPPTRARCDFCVQRLLMR